MQADLLADFYAATVDRARLTRALDRVRELTNATSATLHVFQRSAIRLRHQWQHSCSHTPTSAYSMAMLDDQNPRILSALNPPSTIPCLIEDAGLPEVLHPQLQRWQEQLRVQGMGRFIAARVSLDQDREVGLALHAKIDGSVMDAGASDLMVGLMPHLRETVLLAARVDTGAREHQALRTTFDRMRAGLVTLSANGRVLSINPAARQLLGLSAAATGLPPSLQTRIAETGPQGFVCWKAGERHLHIFTERLFGPPEGAERIGWTAETWLLAIFDPEEQAGLPDAEWTRCYGLTPAETAVLGGIAAGADIAEVATQRAISIHTARTQLKSVMAKVGARRQAQLGRLVWTSRSRWFRAGD
ncbi:hypothetical protein H7F53_01605 [Novosphingobium piscinae]|uniref:PAS domain-containing protein n=1 Tax=Novosphingobium piscinae TaxID=1507448 RepID=A0A7X1FVW4_9SPHN|nr:PAS domain-containing protein [Novosphingobium piscinae]MBC2667839.1 hypothetical protein [Novosphingobium piscinae]